MSKHIVYAVIDRPGDIRARVSGPMSYDSALAFWDAYDDAMEDNRATDRPQLTAARMPIKYLVVRSADDPNWPSHGPLVTIR